MRGLTQAQKKVLTQHYLKTGEHSINTEVSRELEDINDYETLWSDARRFINDYSWKVLSFSRNGMTANEVKEWVKAFR